jgi:NADH-quinone oxidoreductase subunit N
MPALLTTRAGFYDPMLLAGIALMITGIGFKLALVPFHLWTPDVYEGAPAPVTAFVATVSKGALFGLLLRYFRESPASGGSVFLVFTIIAIASMVAGNLLALLQNNVKRILAYSSIAHLGYLLVAFQAGGALGGRAATFYLTAYFVTTLGAFGVVAVLSAGDRDADRIEDYRGLFWRRPALAGVLVVMLFSLAGIPLTAGFLGKFYVVAAGAASATWLLLLVLVTTSAIAIYYYLRIIVAIYATEEPTAVQAERVEPRVHAASRVVLTVLTGVLFWLGIYPAPLLAVIQRIFIGLI